METPWRQRLVWWGVWHGGERGREGEEGWWTWHRELYIHINKFFCIPRRSINTNILILDLRNLWSVYSVDYMGYTIRYRPSLSWRGMRGNYSQTLYTVCYNLVDGSYTNNTILLIDQHQLYTHIYILCYNPPIIVLLLILYTSSLSSVMTTNARMRASTCGHLAGGLCTSRDWRITLSCTFLTYIQVNSLLLLDWHVFRMLSSSSRQAFLFSSLLDTEDLEM